MKFEQRLVAGKDLHYQFSTVPESDYYYIGIAPNRANGAATLVAKKSYTGDYSKYKSIFPPPKQIKIKIHVSPAGIVTSHRIESSTTMTHKLYLYNTRKTSRGKVMIIKSEIYKNSKWEALLPTKGGDDYSLEAVLK